MPIDFSPLQRTDPAGAFFAGQQAAQQQAEQNRLREMQMMQMEAQRENALALREQRQMAVQERQAKMAQAAQRQDFLTRLGAKMAEGGHKLDRPTLGSVLQFGMQSGEDSLIKLATEGLRALDEEDLYQREQQRVGAAPDAAVTRERVQNMLLSPSARVREQGKALATTLPKEPAPRASTLMTPEEEAQRIRIARESRPPAQPRAEPAPRTTKVELADGSIGVMNLDTGEITSATVGGQPAKGKPSAFAEKTAAQRKQLSLDLDRAITELTDATKKGGLIDQSTGSGAGRLVDVGAGFFGQATPGAIAAGKLAPIADMVLKMVPRFEGPQSDKDTKSYKEAAGQLADSSLPNAIRKQAGLEIVRLMKARKNQFVTSEMAVEGAGPAQAPAATKSGATVSNW